MSTGPEYFRRFFFLCEKKEFGMGMAPEAVDEEMLVLLQWT